MVNVYKNTSKSMVGKRNLFDVDNHREKKIYYGLEILRTRDEDIVASAKIHFYVACVSVHTLPLK